ncbi:unnamed protein product [Linum tenue]|uniref:Transcription repressor n=1 Tax=Linum tenue TaxID=586396 RepID=A0AAV0KUB3_9ROSI|nr:unnamed protein product [Linum tenue]
MAEMVEANGLRDWESLEKLLGCYLTMNEKSNHDYIVATFVDLLVGLSFVATAKDAAPEEGCCCSSRHHRGRQHYSPSSLLLFYTSFSSSCSSSEDSSSTPTNQAERIASKQAED